MKLLESILLQVLEEDPTKELKITQYYHELLEQGKSKGVILESVANKFTIYRKSIVHDDLCFWKLAPSFRNITETDVHIPGYKCKFACNGEKECKHYIHTGYLKQNGKINIQRKDG